jgi:hypothetical protein
MTNCKVCGKKCNTNVMNECSDCFWNRINSPEFKQKKLEFERQEKREFELAFNDP